MRNISPSCPVNGRCIVAINLLGETKFGINDLDCHDKFCELKDCSDKNEMLENLKDISNVEKYFTIALEEKDIQYYWNIAVGWSQLCNATHFKTREMAITERKNIPDENIVLQEWGIL